MVLIFVVVFAVPRCQVRISRRTMEPEGAIVWVEVCFDQRLGEILSVLLSSLSASTLQWDPGHISVAPFSIVKSSRKIFTTTSMGGMAMSSSGKIWPFI